MLHWWGLSTNERPLLLSATATSALFLCGSLSLGSGSLYPGGAWDKLPPKERRVAKETCKGRHGNAVHALTISCKRNQENNTAAAVNLQGQAAVPSLNTRPSAYCSSPFVISVPFAPLHCALDPRSSPLPTNVISRWDERARAHLRFIALHHTYCNFAPVIQ